MGPENSQIEINLPQEETPSLPTPRQLQFLKDYGLEGLEKFSKEQVDVLIEAMEHGRVVYHYINPDADHFPLWMRRHIIQFIINDPEIKSTLIDRKMDLDQSAFTENPVEPEQIGHFKKLQDFIEWELPKFEPETVDIPKKKPKKSNLWKWLVAIILWELVVAAFYFL